MSSSTHGSSTRADPQTPSPTVASRLSRATVGGRAPVRTAVVVVLAVCGCVLLVLGLVGGGGSEPVPSPPAAPAAQGEGAANGLPAPPQQAAGAPGAIAPADRGHPLALDRSTPAQIEIPTIGARSPLIELGLNSDGTMEVPSFDRPEIAGWYRHSPTPGEVGPAVIAGHVDSRSPGKGIFYRLGAVRAGDSIRIRRSDETVAEFTVDRVVSFNKDQFPTQAVYGDVDHSGLRLITCGGSYDPSSGEYSENTIVFASLTDTMTPD